MGRLILVLFFTWIIPFQVEAQSSYPSKPVRLVVGFPPGGANDILARLIGGRMQEAWGQTVVVENKPGANAIIGTDFVAKSAPDGYTLLIGASGAMAFNPGLYDKLPYDPVRDFAPITLLGSFPLVLGVNPSLPAQSVKPLQLPEVRGRMAGLGIDPVGNTPEQLGAILRADLDKWTAVAKSAGVKAE